ncbi:MAG: hypothetical protein RLY74_839, partial [Actinomycetota bacterium]
MKKNPAKVAVIAAATAALSLILVSCG